MTLRQKRFRPVRMRRAAAKSRTEVERAKWGKLSRKLAAANDDMTLKQRLQRSLELERAKKGKDHDK